MKFKAKIRIVGTDTWYWEEFSANCGDPKCYVLEVIQDFNDSLRPGERQRKYGGMLKILDDSREHEWEKSNLVTIEKRGRFYDTYRCRNCPVTAKRFGIGGNFVRDRKYKANKWEMCHGG